MHRFRFLFSLLILLQTFYINAQDLKFIDSLQTILNQRKKQKEELKVKSASLADSIEADIYYKLSQLYWTSKLDLSNDYALKCLNLSQKIGYEKGIAKAHTSLGVINYNKGQYNDALKNHQISLKIRRKLKDKKGLIKSHNNIGNTLALMGNYSEAIKSYFESLKISEELNSDPDIAVAYENIGNIYVALKNYQEASKNYLKALNITTKKGDLEGIAHLNLNMGKVFVAQGELQKAILVYNKSLKYYTEIGDKLREIDCYISLGRVFINLKEYSNSLEYFEKALKLCKEMDYNDGMASVYGNVAKVYYKQNRIKEAKNSLISALEKSKVIGSLEYISACYKELMKIDSISGNYKSALENYMNFIIYRDSITNSEKLREIAQTKMQYEFDKKEAAIKSKQAIKDALAKKEIQQQKIIILTIILGSALLLLSLLFLINRRKTKHALEVNKLENKTLRSQLNPHFIFNALASIQKYMNQHPEKAENYLAKFGKLMREVLENSEKEFITLEEEFNMLKNYMDLENLRVNKGFNYEINVEENIDAEEVKIPPLLLQPIIENAIWHGVAKGIDKGNITIQCQKMNHNLKISIENKSENQSENINIVESNFVKKKSFGLQIVKDRLKLLWKDKGSNSSIESTNTANGMIVNLVIPI